MTMTPTTYTNTYTSFQSDLERRINADVGRTYAQVVPRSGSGMTSVSRETLLAEALGAVALTYGPVATSFGMYLFEEYTDRKATALLDDFTPAVTSSVISLSRKSEAPLPLLQGSITRHVMNRARGTIHGSVARNGDLAYARVPNYVNQRDGKGPCTFCIVLATRGPIYADTESAGARGTGNEYHDECYCVPQIMRKARADDWGDPKDWPRGYNPERLYKEIYDPSHEYMDDIRDVTRKIREKHPDFQLGR